MAATTGGFITRKDAAAYMGVTTRTIAAWTDVGLLGVRLGAEYFGRTPRYTVAQLEAFRQATNHRRSSLREAFGRPKRRAAKRSSRVPTPSPAG